MFYVISPLFFFFFDLFDVVRFKDVCILINLFLIKGLTLSMDNGLKEDDISKAAASLISAVESDTPANQ